MSIYMGVLEKTLLEKNSTQLKTCKYTTKIVHPPGDKHFSDNGLSLRENDSP